MSLSNVSQFSTAVTTSMDSTVIPFNGAGVAPEYIYGSAVEQGVEMSINNYGTVEAFRVVDGGLGANGATATATEMLTTEAVVDGQGVVTGTTIKKFPAATTGAGTVKSGALAASVPVGYVVGGVAIGAGIGLKEAATHREFWDDLVTLGDGVNSPKDTVRVIWRMLEDGGIQSYCDKRSVDLIIHNLYETQAVNAVDKISPDITHTGDQNITIGTLDSGIVTLACSACGLNISAVSIETVYNAARTRYPNTNVVWVQVQNRGSAGTVEVKCYNIDPDANYRVVGDALQGYKIADMRSHFAGSASVEIDVDGSISGHVYYRTASSETDQQIPVGVDAGGVGTIIGTASNAGARVIPKNPYVLYNGEDLLPPDDEADFWTTFSDWLANSFEQPGYNPWNNTITPTTWIPFTFPNGLNWQTQPSTGVQPDIWTGTYELPEAYPEPVAEPVPLPIPEPWIWPSFDKVNPPDPTPEAPEPDPWDDTPDPPAKPPVGNPPISIVDPTSVVGSSDALFTVYNPSQANINALGAYLWTNSIIDLISQFFQNPLDAIISLHVIYCTPSTSGTKNIKLGYLDSGVSASIVTSQYKSIDCGDITIPEVYHNALDYSAVKLNLFLPFIGFREINTKEAMGARLNVQYKIDVYTGTCLALVYVIRPNVRQLLYSFEGNCSVQVPLTGADRSRLIAGLVTAGVSAYTGNPAGVIGGIGSIGVSIERSGGFSGNAGAMGVKKPYLIINRAINAQADGYNTLYGFPVNKKVKLIQVKGFTRVQSIHVDIPYATREEIDTIYQMLTSGIII